MPENTGRLEAQLRAASGHTSKRLKDLEGVEALVEVSHHRDRQFWRYGLEEKPRGFLVLAAQVGG